MNESNKGSKIFEKIIWKKCRTVPRSISIISTVYRIDGCRANITKNSLVLSSFQQQMWCAIELNSRRKRAMNKVRQEALNERMLCVCVCVCKNHSIRQTVIVVVVRTKAKIKRIALIIISREKREKILESNDVKDAFPFLSKKFGFFSLSERWDNSMRRFVFSVTCIVVVIVGTFFLLLLGILILCSLCRS